MLIKAGHAVDAGHWMLSDLHRRELEKFHRFVDGTDAKTVIAEPKRPRSSRRRTHQGIIAGRAICTDTAHIRASYWLTDLRRRVQHYGWKYDYKARAVKPCDAKCNSIGHPSRTLRITMSTSRLCPSERRDIAPDTAGGDVDVTEQFLRDLVKSEAPRLVRSRSRALLVEEMEVCLGRARVDLAVIADRLIGIEIKGPKDDVTRLPHQALAYSKCFDRMVLLVDESLADKARPLIPTWWGIVVAMHGNGEFEYRFERRPRPNPDLDIDALLSLLWREEVDALTEDLLGISTKPRATKRAIRNELCKQIDVNVLRHASLNKLRDRSDWRTIPIHEECAVA